MNLKPVPQSSPPGYPTRAEFLSDERALEKHLPWSGRIAQGLAGAITLLVGAHLTGCSTGPPEPDWRDGVPPRFETVVAQGSTWVRSIYDDGSNANFGWLGCVAIMPPSYFPEDEAIQLFGDGAMPDND